MRARGFTVGVKKYSTEGGNGHLLSKIHTHTSKCLEISLYELL